MRRYRLVLLPLLGLAPSAPARAEVTVAFRQPESFTDASLDGIRPASADSPVLAAIGRSLERLGRRLPPGQDLRIEVLDVDLAGMPDPWRNALHRPRLLTPATWPRMRLRYALHAPDGRVIAEGTEDLSDTTYLQRSEAVRSLSVIRFEEPMLADWFGQRFGQRR